jgi:thiazolinyl imide reductase
VYLAAFRRPDFPFELAGILSRGSAQSAACADRYRVPLFTDPGQLPSDIDIACVVVSSAINGGRGAELARELMARGINVLQEHPLHHDELAGCLRDARRHGVVYQVSTHYTHVAPVRGFLGVAHKLIGRQQPVFIDAGCAFQVTYSLMDIVGKALGRVRPWAFVDVPPFPAALGQLVPQGAPFRSVDGVVGGVPISLRIQNQMHPTDPDNYYHFFHRITLGSEGGNVSLTNTHGPVLWSPRPHMPRDVKAGTEPEDSSAQFLGFSSASVVGSQDVPVWRDIMSVVWPQAVQHALEELQRAVVRKEDPLRKGQYHLSLCRLVQDINDRLGPPEFVSGREPEPLAIGSLVDSAGGR